MRFSAPRRRTGTTPPRLSAPSTRPQRAGRDGSHARLSARAGCRQCECADRARPHRFLFTLSNSGVFSFPRRFAVRGFPFLPLLASLPLPRPRGGRSAERRCPHFDRARKARPHVCETQPSRGKPERASRRSTLAILGPLRALRLRSCLRLARADNLAARVSRPAGPRSRTSRDQIRPHPGTPHLAPPAGSSPETPLVSEDGRIITTSAFRSQQQIATCVQKEERMRRGRLMSALLGNDVWDALSWGMLSVPIAVFYFALAVRRRG